MALKIPTVQVGLEKSIQKAVRNVSARGGLNLNINDRNFSRPLGKITGSISEFNKSLEASNARVLAFGASVAVFEQNGFACWRLLNNLGLLALITCRLAVVKPLSDFRR